MSFKDLLDLVLDNAVNWKWYRLTLKENGLVDCAYAGHGDGWVVTVARIVPQADCVRPYTIGEAPRPSHGQPYVIGNAVFVPGQYGVHMSIQQTVRALAAAKKTG